MLSGHDITGVYAIPPTPAKEGSNRWDATDTVDLEETERLTNQLIQDGCGGLIVLGTTGECATLTEAEWEAFVDCLLSTVDGRVPTFVGATSLGTHDIVRRLRFLEDRGADGTLLGLPMWQPCTEEMAVKFYASISEAFPELAIMVYANSNAFRFDFPASFWAGVAESAPTVVTAKFASPAGYVECLEASNRKINLLPMDAMAHTFAAISPDTVTACWATAASMGPQPSVALMRALEARDMAKAEEIGKDLFWANETFLPAGPDGRPDFEEFGRYNIQLEKLRFEASGYCTPGPVRPPYDVVPESYAERARECGRRWAELVKKYS
ncbi:MAG TPA: dihydrodipicolinate synthase family protein [Acidimicrobiales bacterium]|nr:dihydrodipicolinate synthase family protein [Acidimicrobiales bacterium]